MSFTIQNSSNPAIGYPLQNEKQLSKPLECDQSLFTSLSTVLESKKLTPPRPRKPLPFERERYMTDKQLAKLILLKITNFLEMYYPSALQKFPILKEEKISCSTCETVIKLIKGNRTLFFINKEVDCSCNPIIMRLKSIDSRNETFRVRQDQILYYSAALSISKLAYQILLWYTLLLRWEEQK